MAIENEKPQDSIISAEISALNKLGYKQELRRDFSLLGIVAFSYSIVTSWTALSGVLIVGVNAGGPPVIIWSWIFVCLFNLAVAYSLAEMCSAYPVAGGQYYWVAVFAPKPLRRGMSYICGWFTLIGILAMGATSHFVTANFFLGLANLNHRGYVIERWHTVLVAWGIALCTLLFNTTLSRLFNKVSQGFLFLNIASLVVVVATILATNNQKQSASFVFKDFVNFTGFSDSYAAVVGLLQAAFGMCCYDSASRMTEEVKHARKQAPRAIVMAVYIGFVTGLIFLIATCFCMGDVELMATTSTAVPIIEIFYWSTGSNAGASVLASLILIVGFGASNALTATGSRAIYAFARDRGLPFSGWLRHVHDANATPVNALFATVAFQMVLLAIYFGAVQGFSTVIAIATEGFYVSYAIPLLARLLSLATKEPVWRIDAQFSLGAWSVPLNVVGLLFLLFTTITFNLPTLAPVTAENMNYCSAAVGAIMIIALVTWCTTGRRHYRGPMSEAIADATEGTAEGLRHDLGPAKKRDGAEASVA